MRDKPVPTAWLERDSQLPFYGPEVSKTLVPGTLGGP